VPSVIFREYKTPIRLINIEWHVWIAVKPVLWGTPGQVREQVMFPSISPSITRILHDPSKLVRQFMQEAVE
jgi:hypothetical protein